VLLLACTAVALLWANSPWAGTYSRLWEARLTAGAPGFGLRLSLHHWVNDGLMSVFFLLVGLEIKRELVAGELASRRSAALPLAAAIGGMLVPAALYAVVNAGGPGAAGWGVPMATDIAFALGTLALLGDRVPTALRIFLTALAIADDLGAVLVIAFFYAGALDWAAVGGAAVALAVLIMLNRAGSRRPLTYVLLGVALWLFVRASGIHATIAGVLLAFTIPARTGPDDDTFVARSPLQRLELALQGPVAFIVLPLFALANAGVPFTGSLGVVLHSPVALGVALGLILGKPLGITLASYLAVRSGVAQLPTGVTWPRLHGAAWLGGIGFTMSLFIAGLAFPGPAMLGAAKFGILGGSVCAGVIGYVLMRRATRSPSLPCRDDASATRHPGHPEAS
jgi:NhaA family Na+:H+ antiporter